jgi:phosphoglycolate/pyridoxal phosphate phosphatase family enzyme
MHFNHISQINMEKYDTILLDCDGVIYEGQYEIEGSIKALNQLEDAGKKLYFFTNNSSKTAEQFAKKLSDLGYNARPSQIYSTSRAAPAYLQEFHPEVSKVFLIGMAGFRAELEKEGYTVLQYTDIEVPQCENYFELLEKLKPDPSIQAVLSGVDLKFSAWAATYASKCVQSGAHFISSNSDPYFILRRGKMPGCGTILSFLETALRRKAEIIGKPSTFMLDLAIKEQSLDKSRCLMVGDRLDTDILFGINSGVDSALVLTGVHGVSDITNYGHNPTYIFQNLLALSNSILNN